MAIAPGPERVVLSWDAPAADPALLAYRITLSTGRTVWKAAPATGVTVTGLADGAAVSATVAAVGAGGVGSIATTAAVTPEPVPETLAQLPLNSWYYDMAVAPDGSIYLSTTDAIVVRSPAGAITTVVHGDAATPAAEGSAALETAVKPRSMALAANGDLYWFDKVTMTIRRLHAGTVDTIAGVPGVPSPSMATGPAVGTSVGDFVYALAVSPVDGAVLFVDYESDVVRRFTIGGTIATVAGVRHNPGEGAFSGDGGPAVEADLDSPQGVAVDGTGAVYVADTFNHRVRRFTIGGTIDTVAGDGTHTFSHDPVAPATQTGVYAPAEIDWAPDRGLLVDTTGRERVLKGTQLARFGSDAFDGALTMGDPDAPVLGQPETGAFMANGDVVGLAWTDGKLLVAVDQPVGPVEAGTMRGTLRSVGPWLPAQDPTAPGAPVVAPTARPGAGSARVSWLPASDGGSPLTSYVVTASPGGPSVTVPASATSALVTGLEPGAAATFTVTAVNAVGTGDASAASSPVVVRSSAPFADWSALIDRQYRDLVARPSTSTERSAWMVQFAAATADAGDLADALRRSPESATDVDPVIRLYRAFLGRTPDAAGLQYWLARKRAVAPARRWSLTQMATAFTASHEFTAKYGKLTSLAFVTRIYTDVLGRPADPSGVAYWTQQLTSKRKTRAQVMVGFSESSEYRTKQARPTDAAAAHVLLLGRAPSADETLDWVSRATSGTTDAVLLGELLASPAYAARITG
ncbi:DUF4214 domain-containing protein [Aquihabitans sp. McL0605]|uniref:DUF4214 domain-containing protein n=1 Tax=Aquihabitans sp. McL0605 TaxID=3415671 RepID=UPI003CEC58BF